MRSQTESVGASFAARLAELQQRLKIPGIAAAIADDGDLTWSGGFGHADNNGRAVTPDTPFPVTSLTKPLAAILLMQLVERKSLDLDEPIGRFLTEPASKLARLAHRRSDVTVRHVLTHTSGLPIVPLRKRTYGKPSGVAFRYNSAAYGLLTHVLTKITGKPFKELITERILSPCGMSRSTPGLAGVTDLARPLGRRGLIGRLFKPRADINAAVGLVTTVGDYAKFDHCAATGALVGPDTLEQIWTAADPQKPYGLGYFVFQRHGETIVWHFGVQPRFHSSLYLRFVARRRTMIFLANSDAIGRVSRLAHGDLGASPFAQLAFTA